MRNQPCGLALLLSGLIVSCAYYSPIWVDSDAPARESGIATSFDWSSLPGVIRSIDGKAVGTGYERAKLSSGRHAIEYAYYPAEFGAHPKGMIEIDLLGGHAYEFRIKLCFWCIPRKYAAWVDDTAASEPVWGRRPDWPSWYL